MAKWCTRISFHHVCDRCWCVCVCVCVCLHLMHHNQPINRHHSIDSQNYWQFSFKFISKSSTFPNLRLLRPQICKKKQFQPFFVRKLKNKIPGNEKRRKIMFIFEQRIITLNSLELNFNESCSRHAFISIFGE